MAFCSNCGKELAVGAKFCFECGTPVAKADETVRRTVFSGEIHKCPSCGEVLQSLTAICPSCGHEINSAKLSPALKEFIDEINECDKLIANAPKKEIPKRGWKTWKNSMRVLWVILNILTSCISAPSSTKNKEKQRDPDAHQVKKGNTWHFGYKAHIGVDKDSGIVHTVKVTAANQHDVSMTSELLTGEETVVYGDSGYLGAEKREDAVKKNANGKRIRYKINRRPSQIAKKSTRSQGQLKRREHEKSSVRAKVEHVFAVVKGQLRYRKTRYRGLRKQTAKLNMMFALANLILADRPCLAV